MPQPELEGFLAGLRAWHVTAVVDGEVDDLEHLAACADVLSYSRERRGFGMARRAGLSAGRAVGAAWILVVDADGQYRPEALARLVEQVTDSDVDAVLPQRSLVRLMLDGEGSLDRRVDERFHAWCVTRAAGRPELADRDLQPGAYLLRPSAVDHLLTTVTARRYSWDLEASYRLMSSPLRVSFAGVESAQPSGTSFTVDESRRMLHALADLLGRDAVLGSLAEFTQGDEGYARYVRDSLGAS